MLGKKGIFILLFLILISIICVLSFKYISLSNKIKQQQTKKIIKKEVKSNFKKDFDSNENIVFFGDSITYIYPIEEIYDNNKIIRSGVSGYTTTDLLDNIEEMLYQYNPTKVFLLIGTNDIMSDNSEKKQEETVENIKKIYREIRKNRPKAKIYIESIYPVNKELNEKMVRNRNNEAIKNINREIEKFCEKEKITYIDLFNELVDDNGNFDEKYTGDGLHPVDLGYAKITKLLLPYIYE